MTSSIRRFVASLAVLFTLASLNGCSSKNAVTTSSDKGTPVKLVLNWYPEAEHGGYYAALVHGIFAKHGLDVEIRPGGKTTIVPQELALGRIQFGIGNADDVLMAREQDAPLVALMAPMQDGPRCIMVREDSGIKNFEDLKNITLQIDPARPYVPFMKGKGLLQENVTTVPYFGVVSQLVSDPHTAQQAYNFSEPFMAQQAGVQVRNLMMSEIGYNPYASVLIATEDFVAKNPDLAKRMVLACVEGWQKYLEDGKQTNEYIHQQNREGITLEALTFGVEKLKSLCLPAGFDPSKLGAMTSERWTTLTQQLQDLHLISNKVQASQAYSTDYLPKDSSKNKLPISKSAGVR
jgi:NitT/TauT family transport system substrate-binding protein